VSEIGLDASRFSSVKHFTSWLGLCPGSCITGGKVKNSRTRRVVNRAANAFRMAALAAGKTHSALGAFYRRLRTRLGTPKAITATAHKLARIFYHLWSSGESYDDPGVNYYEQRYQEQIVKGLRKKPQALGFNLVAAPSAQFLRRDIVECALPQNPLRELDTTDRLKNMSRQLLFMQLEE
jgi:transposase